MRVLKFTGILAALAVAFVQPGLAQSSLASRVLLVYNPSDSNSAAVATHYQTARGIPSANLCSVSVPETTTLTFAEYVTLLREPIRTCLNTVGTQNILYIVLAYLRPYVVENVAETMSYSIDSYLSDIWDQYATQFFTIPPAVHRYYAESQSQGNGFIPFQSLAAYRNTTQAQLLYGVWRLDGATAAVAEAQVDSVMAATAAGGLPISQVSGSPPNACIDMTVLPTLGQADNAYGTGNWDLYRAAGLLTTANKFNVVTDSLVTSFGVSPSPDCFNTGLYSGWYNLNVYYPAFSWDKGSIGWDLDSSALNDPRGGVYWGANAIANGVAVTSGAMAEPYLEGIPRPAVILSLLQGANVGDAFLRNTRWLKWMILNVGDPLYQPFPGGVAPFNVTYSPNAMSVFLTQNTFRNYVGGIPVGVTISLASPAPAGGLTLNLTANSSGLTFPSTVTIPAGSSSSSFLTTTSAVTAESDVQLTAASGSITAANTISIYPLLSGVNFTLNPFVGGGTLPAQLALNGNAPIGGATIQLSSDTPSVATVPASVTIAAGLAFANFNVTTSAVGTNTTVNITSTYAGASNTATLIIAP